MTLFHFHLIQSDPDYPVFNKSNPRLSSCFCQGQFYTWACKYHSIIWWIFNRVWPENGVVGLSRSHCLQLVQFLLSLHNSAGSENCPQLEAAANSYIFGSAVGKETVAPGESIFNMCNKGSKLISGTIMRTCTGDGVFTGSPLVCSGLYIFDVFILYYIWSNLFQAYRSLLLHASIEYGSAALHGLWCHDAMVMQT